MRSHKHSFTYDWNPYALARACVKCDLVEYWQANSELEEFGEWKRIHGDIAEWIYEQEVLFRRVRLSN